MIHVICYHVILQCMIHVIICYHVILQCMIHVIYMLLCDITAYESCDMLWSSYIIVETLEL